MTTFKHYLAETTDLNINPSSFRPTEHQRSVLSQINVADTPELAADQVARGAKFIQARNQLIRLGFVTVVQGGLEISQTGEDLIQAQALDQAEFNDEADPNDPTTNDVSTHTDNE